MTILRRKLATAWALPRFVRLWLGPVWLLIGLAAVAIRLLPFRRIAALLGTDLGASGFIPLADAVQSRRALQIRATIALAIKYAPFRADCLPQAIAGALLCRVYQVPYALHFGARMRPPTDHASAMDAHAWLVTDRIAVTGGWASFDHYALLLCLVFPALPVDRQVSADAPTPWPRHPERAD
ncbi:lasso peptide biosynthesis B2 protein [Sphingomonas sp.]|uniref:lasso peptide biosynthesis B2 protein n=1 Tax=Sphingomonas sp. TaxID=28214 RepID=UPI003B3B3E54